ncbi:GntR family transcriptional regulator [Gordonia sp. (in: high G+C Gram-positive bacteria)]|uniref:GntR family transcriptional regulator n=1 Tax=Gordonia sp. (in: high G+C Gram-positive bacteria) TaxID=84139 RepID=UPI00169C5050|nr:GntR family transcriptional regulator [Gordonia sp. (in: high G+C Gram-positive bacteria)]NLG47531.1 GntR family transcriptional regulator [Gordonia sp. (in: high G+C Gram-positive bacteria)]
MASDSSTTDRQRRRPQLSEEVASTIRHKIMTAEVLPGDRIRIDETAVELGVSVTPVREALLTLRGEGMVLLAPHRGYEVARLTRTDVDDLFWLQGETAARIARRTAAVITPAQIDDLAWANAQFRDAVRTGDSAALTQAEFEFHRAHNQFSDSAKLAWMLQNTTRYTPHEMYASDPDWGLVTADRHDELIAAYRAGDAEAAADCIRREFTDGADRLIKHLSQTGIWDDAESNPVSDS